MNGDQPKELSFWDDTKWTRSVEVVGIEDYSGPWHSEEEEGNEALLTGRNDGRDMERVGWDIFEERVIGRPIKFKASRSGAMSWVSSDK